MIKHRNKEIQLEAVGAENLRQYAKNNQPIKEELIPEVMQVTEENDRNVISKEIYEAITKSLERLNCDS